MAMKEHNFLEVVDLIVKEDDRYGKGGYVFLKKALDYTIKKERKSQGKVVSKQRHVTGQELLQGVREYVLDQYGPMSYTVLSDWGIHSCEDIGEMVFNLIDYSVFSKNDQDSKEDFASIYTFEEAFIKPFQPAQRRLKRPRYRPIETL